MSTRGVLARLTNALPPQFAGRYHHWDSYPTGLGKTLWSLYHGHFNRDLNVMMRILVDEHPAGWSTINGADFNLLSGFTELANRKIEAEDEADGVRPECYCHGDRAEEAWEVTQKNASGSGCEWAYAFASGSHPQHDVMLILSSYRPSGQKMIGFFGQGDPQAVWAPVATIGLQGAEPDWNSLDGALPLDPLFDTDKFKRGAQGQTLVHRDEGRPGIYVVRLPQGGPHYVSIVREDSEPRFYCTCSPDEIAESPDCVHSQALRQHLEERHQLTCERQRNGLQYEGCRIVNDGHDGVSVFVWEGGRPSVLSAKPSQRLINHSPCGFEWGYDGSGPAQLALAILLDFLGDEEMAVKHHQAFKRQIICQLPQEDVSWCLKNTDIELFFQTLNNPS